MNDLFKRYLSPLFPPVPSPAPPGEHDLPIRLYAQARREDAFGRRSLSLAGLSIIAAALLASSGYGPLILCVSTWNFLEYHRYSAAARALRLVSGEVSVSRQPS